MFGQRFGRRNVDQERSCSTNSTSSGFVFFHVKYVYDCEKPAFASSVIIAGRVNASERNTVSGMRLAHLGDQPLPERDRLRVRVVDAEDGHARVAPVEHDVEDRLPEALRSSVSQSRLWMSW